MSLLEYVTLVYSHYRLFNDPSHGTFVKALENVLQVNSMTIISD